jgi:hypothetical protein
MNYDDEIDKILHSIKQNNNIKPLNMVISERAYAINEAFQNYMHYETNIKNKETITEELEDYQYVQYIELQVGDIIKELLVEPYFFNIRLSKENKVSDIKNGIICLRNECIRKKKKRNYFFKKISKDEMVKMKLMELIYES